jgi:hypothetical protein
MEILLDLSIVVVATGRRAFVFSELASAACNTYLLHTPTHLTSSYFALSSLNCLLQP